MEYTGLVQEQNTADISPICKQSSKVNFNVHESCIYIVAVL
jgi:hypothetical protein